MSEAFLVDGVRTPIGRYGGALAPSAPTTSPRTPIARWSPQPQVDWAAVDDVILGCANQAGEDNRNVARMALLLAGLPARRCPARPSTACAAPGVDAVGDAARRSAPARPTWSSPAASRA